MVGAIQHTIQKTFYISCSNHGCLFFGEKSKSHQRNDAFQISAQNDLSGGSNYTHRPQTMRQRESLLFYILWGSKMIDNVFLDIFKLANNRSHVSVSYVTFMKLKTILQIRFRSPCWSHGWMTFVHVVTPDTRKSYRTTLTLLNCI